MSPGMQANGDDEIIDRIKADRQHTIQYDANSTVCNKGTSESVRGEKIKRT